MTLCHCYRNLPVKRKLQLIISFTVAAALALACTAILAYDQYSGRQEMQRDLGILAEIFASNSTAALAFRGSKGRRGDSFRTQGQASRRQRRDLRADGKPFATYFREGTPPTAAPPVRGDSAWYRVPAAKAVPNYRAESANNRGGVHRIGRGVRCARGSDVWRG